MDARSIFLRLLGGLCLLLVFSESFAYEWQKKGAPNGRLFPTAGAACGGNGGKLNNNNPIPETQTEVGCCVPDMTGWCYTSFSVVRVGTCDGTYQPDGSCDEPPNSCESASGKTIESEFLYGYDYSGNDGPYTNTNPKPTSICSGGCSYSSGRPTECVAYRNTDGTSGPAVYCRFPATGTGSECSGDGGDYTPDQPNQSCPPGTTRGVVNSRVVCLGGTDGGGGDGGGDTGQPGDSGDPGDGGGDGDSGDGGDGGSDGGGGSGGGGNDGGDGSGDGDGDGDGDGNGNGNGNGNGGSGSGDGDGDGEGGDYSQGIGNCADERCSFRESNVAYVDDVLGETDVTNPDDIAYAGDFFERLEYRFSVSPLGTALDGIKFPEGRGICETGSFDIFETTIRFDSHCELFESISGILSAIFLAIWALSAVRIFLSA